MTNYAVVAVTRHRNRWRQVGRKERLMTAYTGPFPNVEQANAWLASGAIRHNGGSGTRTFDTTPLGYSGLGNPLYLVGTKICPVIEPVWPPKPTLKPVALKRSHRWSTRSKKK